MKIKIFYVALLALSTVSCQKHLQDQHPASLEIKLVSDDTKVSGTGGDEEKAVSGYQVLVYDMSSRMLEAYATPDPSSVSISMQCTTGPKEVVVLANAPDVSGIVSYDAFLKTKSSLADNGIGRLVMEGNASPDLTASGGTVTVNLRRMVSKVVLDAVTVDFEVDAYDQMDFILQKVYLTNVAGDKSYLSKTADPSQWYNMNVRSQTPEVDALVYEDIADVNLKDTKMYTLAHHFYCYPNPHVNDTFSSDQWTPRPTRLVVEAMLGNVVYYYPVSLPELKQNTRYHVSLHIVRPGATSPEQDMDKYAVSLKINIEEWNGPENVTETI